MNNYRIEESFRIYNRRMDAIYSEIYSLRESCSASDWELLQEGFWSDKFKAVTGSIAGGAGKAVGNVTGAVSKSVDYVHGLGSTIYDKGVELGKKAIEVTKDFYNKVKASILQGIESIKKAPGLLWDSVSNLCATIAGEIAETYKKAKAKGEEWAKAAKETAVGLYVSMAESLSGLYASTKEWASKNIDAFKKMIVEKRKELSEAAEAARKSSNANIKQIGEAISNYFAKFKDGAIKVSKHIGMLTIGLVALPFIGVYAITKKAYELGDELIDASSKGIEKLKLVLGDAWKNMKVEFSVNKEEAEDWWAGLSDEEKSKAKSSAGLKMESFRYVKTFESFNR